ncbi:MULTISPECIES: GDP-mannose mannosyl hydrolase [unclassified Pseudoalteromonas]|uniref:GDP-mannose mannosyl hydrolase n=1 Tax=unclassified Pseudoalteromonas TaxID=194690 RepID=UPI00110832E5|nr:MULTISPECIES: GDP-mannose mannosyl hydrolase [unclassified Pseudoalteromonas]TMN81307.1 GDP-mannose mannosyl hydrolase [Pseudoalteromonas sp. S410]TMN89288.1 GDP-mannose mannosyl hydrolase [Pseudoalteromonas sp. S408]TMN95066.1 GDP-mannose mannosyl hydrolase [Pseudoalteromonas sp. S407]TMN96533.1 GDP-mannose mannosyl hydrolase [Pseudoalteromonas sp. S409]TMO07788.1 GDP-mannose mannosyl hydrolase [Pseudoalteromonas sp. S186]
MMLEKKLFKSVIQNTPLVSIDLVVFNTDGQALLGERLNRPAKGFWFVPGGRILKNESLANAFKRLTLDELGTEFAIEQATLQGPYDHFYDDNVFGNEFTTHYVAISFVIKLTQPLSNLPMDVQHNGYKWFEINDLLNDTAVHKHTKWYFESLSNNSSDCKL